MLWQRESGGLLPRWTSATRRLGSWLLGSAVAVFCLSGCATQNYVPAECPPPVVIPKALLADRTIDVENYLRAAEIWLTDAVDYLEGSTPIGKP